MICKDCNEHLQGDGYSQIIECPNLSDEKREELGVDYMAPDEDVIYCGFEEDDDD